MRYDVLFSKTTRGLVTALFFAGLIGVLGVGDRFNFEIAADTVLEAICLYVFFLRFVFNVYDLSYRHLHNY